GLFYRSSFVNAGVVDQNVDAPVAALDIGEQLAVGVSVTYVAHPRLAVGRRPRELLGHLVQGRLTPSQPDNGPSPRREVEGKPPPDTGRRAGHDRELSVV